MALGKTLEGWPTQLTGLLPDGEGRTVGFLRLVLPGLGDEAALSQDDIDLDRDRAGDTLIGAAITDLGERGSFDERWDDVFGFRDEGAEWGSWRSTRRCSPSPSSGPWRRRSTARSTRWPRRPTRHRRRRAPRTGGSDSGGTTDDERMAAATAAPETRTDRRPRRRRRRRSSPPIPPSCPTPPPSLSPVVEPVVDLVEDLLGGLLG